MGGFKHEQKLSTRPEVERNVTGSTGHSCLSWFMWTVTIVTLFGSFGFLYYIQFHEIQKLKTRIDNLELGYAFSEDNNDIQINSNLHSLIQAEVKTNLPALLGGVDEVCDGKQGEQRSHVVRQIVTSQSCCSSLQRPGYYGSKNEVITAYIGQDVNLPCNSTGFPKPTVTFSPTVDPTGNNRYALTSDGLAILKAQTTDSGTFTCVVENIFGKEIKNIQLIVTDPVVVTTSPSNIVIKEGDNLVIRCLATGSPAPMVTWSHSRPDGTVLQVIGSTGGHISISSDNTLTITNAKASDAGTYTCTGNNQYEKDASTTSVSLNGSPEIISPPKSQVVMEGSTVTLFCTVVSNPPASVTWTYPLTGNKIPLNGHINPDNSLTLSNVDRFNNGDYTCTATNTQGSVTSKSTLTVEKGVTVVTSPHLQPLTGREPVLNFQCSADGDPIPSTTWSKVGSPSLAGNGRYLMVGGNLIITGPNVNTDTGVYECYGQNRNGNNTDKVIVYKELGAITCTATFASVGCSQGMTCGATCPSICDPSSPGATVYGDAHYFEGSSVCLSAYHKGYLPAPGSTRVLFTHMQSGTFASSLKNGVQSLSHAPGVSYDLVRVPSNAGAAGNPLIG